MILLNAHCLLSVETDAGVGERDRRTFSGGGSEISLVERVPPKFVVFRPTLDLGELTRPRSAPSVYQIGLT